MKTLIIALALLVLRMPASAKYYTNKGRPLTGLSFDPPATPPPPPIMVYMKDVDPESPRFARILAAIQTRYKLDQAGFLDRLQRGVTFFLKSPQNHRQEIRILWSPPPAPKSAAP